MKISIWIAALFLSCLCLAQKPLLERLMNIEDPTYNEALSEMQDLSLDAKVRLSKELATSMLDRKDPEQRANAASALGDLCGTVPANSNSLFKGLKDESKIVRQAAVSGLGRCDTRDAAIVKELAGALQDPNDVVRELARSKLERIGTPEAQAALQRATK